MSWVEFGIMYCGARAMMMAHDRGVPQYIADYVAAWTVYWFVRQVILMGGV